MFRPKHAALLASAVTVLAVGGTGVALAASGGGSSSTSSGAATTATTTTTTTQSNGSHCDHDNSNNT